jgi:AcrR family transcriptional regulator
VGTTSENAQRAIAEAALSTFCKRGYGLATLEEIGAQVCLTRGAVLHHFKSKAGLLEAIVGPCRRALAQLLMTSPLDDPPTAGQQRLLLVELADLFLAHRGPLRLLANDISARVQLGLEDQLFMPPERLVNLLVGSNANHLARVRVAAAIGALIQPVSCGWVDLDNETTRGELIEIAVAVFHQPRQAASTRGPEIMATSSKVRAAPLAQVATQ